MDVNVATIIITIITGIFSVITLKIKKSSERINDTIDEQAIFLKKEKELREIIMFAEKERDAVTEQILLYLMKVCGYLLFHMPDTSPDYNETINKLIDVSERLEKEFKEKTTILKNKYRDHDAMMDVIASLQNNINEAYNNKTPPQNSN